MQILWAKPCHPRAGQRARPGTDKAQGLVLQARVESALRLRGGLRVQQWFEFAAQRDGMGHCAPDFVLVLPDINIVIDAKWRWHRQVLGQLWGLYVPVVEVALGRPCRAMAVIGQRPAGNRARPLVCQELGEALRLCRERRDVAWLANNGDPTC